jgi:glycosyltransferase involved in cell wall biosynthesis
MPDSSFSLVLPVYNEEAVIESTIEQLQAILDAAQCQYEIIAVDDGSCDRTATVLATHKDITVLTHRHNRGYGAALKTGIKKARYPLIVITDADGTYPHEQIPHLVALAADFDMVVGARTGSMDYRRSDSRSQQRNAGISQIYR